MSSITEPRRQPLKYPVGTTVVLRHPIVVRQHTVHAGLFVRVAEHMQTAGGRNYYRVNVGHENGYVWEDWLEPIDDDNEATE